jgi:2-hydroxy-3-oxopropionate reductase/glyoxylate/succinic semialdehyde reductase
MLRAGEFPPQFPAKHMAKDLRFAVEAAAEAHAPSPLLSVLEPLYRKLVKEGLGEADFAAVFRALG